MTKVINMNARGTLTLPKGMRQPLGLKAGCQVIAEETGKGILIRPCVMLPLKLPQTDAARFKLAVKSGVPSCAVIDKELAKQPGNKQSGFLMLALRRPL
jgi:hypothetical protein